MKTKSLSLKKLEEVLSFTRLTFFSDICIDCCIIYCILVSIFSYVHHTSSCTSKKIVSKGRNFLQCIKLSVLIDYKVNRNQLHKCLQLVGRFLYQFNRLPINHNVLLYSFETMITITLFLKVFPKVIKNTLFNYIKNLINCIVLEVFQIQEEHFN